MQSEFDCGEGLKNRPKGEEDIESLVIQQIEFCNVILLNKISEVTPEEAGRIRAIIRAIQPKAKIIDCNYADVDFDEILGTGMFDFEEVATSATWVREIEGHHHHDDDNDDDHDDHHHSHHSHHSQDSHSSQDSQDSHPHDHPENCTCGAKACIEFSVRGTPVNRSEMQSRFIEISSREGFDISMQEDTMYRRCRRLICFDMDSTLIQTECIDQLAEKAGVGDKVRDITERAMRGEIDFRESFTERVALLKGLDVSVMEGIAESLPITEGVDRMMQVLKRAGFKTAILSGGFTFFGEYLKRRFGFDYVYANELEVEDGKLTGRYVGDIVDGKRKAELLRLIAQVENVNIAQTIAVGDGANDLPMLSAAGLGIAFHAKPKVKESAKQSISTIGIDGVLYFLGFKDSFIGDTGK